MKEKKVYATIIGGGAAGMICACTAAEKSKDNKILILEKADRIGKKLLVTGNGKCNLTNLNSSSNNYHGKGCENLINILYQKYNPQYILKFFENNGLITASDIKGRVYPISKYAGSVLDVLRYALNKNHVEIECDCNIERINKTKWGFEINYNDTIVKTKKLIIATGGKFDYKGAESGSCDIINMLNFKKTQLSPALSPIYVKSNIIHQLKGIRMSAKVTLKKDGKEIKSEYGEVQFTNNALSGICIFNLSRYANKTDDCIVSVQFLPEMSYNEIFSMLKNRIKLFNKDNISDIFIGMFRKNLAKAIINSCKINENKNTADLTDNEIKALAKVLYSWDFKTTVKSDFKNAQVTAGGVYLNEIDKITFESKKHKDLYIIGEALDIDADCGGYNLQFAFASGMKVGENL